MQLTIREVIQAGFSGIGAESVTLNQKIADVAAAVDLLGHGDRVTTRMIRRQLIQTGRA